MAFEQTLGEKEVQWQAERQELLDKHKQVRKLNNLIESCTPPKRIDERSSTMGV